MDAFFWDYSGMRIHGIGGNRVLLAIFACLRVGKISYRDFLGLVALIFVKSVLLGIDILYGLLFLYQNKNRRNSPKRMRHKTRCLTDRVTNTNPAQCLTCLKATI